MERTPPSDHQQKFLATAAVTTAGRPKRASSNMSCGGEVGGAVVVVIMIAVGWMGLWGGGSLWWVGVDGCHDGRSAPRRTWNGCIYTWVGGSMLVVVVNREAHIYAYTQNTTNQTNKRQAHARTIASSASYWSRLASKFSPNSTTHTSGVLLGSSATMEYTWFCVFGVVWCGVVSRLCVDSGGVWHVHIYVHKEEAPNNK